MNKRSRAFTLVELLVVIAIIGILSSVVVVSLNSSRQRARDSKRVSDIKQIQLALAMYQDLNGSYPDAVNVTNLGAFIPSIPTDPLTRVAYKYAYYTASSVRTTYHLGAALEATNVVTQDDRDCNSAAPTNCPGTGGTWTGGFNGADGFKCDGATTGGLCFDVTP
ncbi:MAG: type II secretion system protein [Candidatus Taylorbacteria bacterium]|nr:type II secretion system protein [Candidatus Taylorbacteria bacterium]